MDKKQPMINELLANGIIKYRLYALVISIFIVLLSSTGLQFLIDVPEEGASSIRLSNSYRIFFNDDNPKLKALDDLHASYGSNDSVLVVLTPKEGTVFQRKVLSAIEDLTEQAWQTPYSTRIDSITNFQHTEGKNDELIVRNLVEDASALSDDKLEKIKTVALNEPLLIDRLVSRNGRSSGISIIVNLPGNNSQEESEVVSFIRELTRKFQKEHPYLEVRLTGIVMLNNAFPEASEHDSLRLIPIMFLLVLVFLGLLTRSAGATFASLSVIVMSITVAMGVAGWLGIKLSIITAVTPIMIVPLAVTDSIHILSNYFQSLRNGVAKKESMTAALRINLQPVFLTSLTTAIGFLSMNFSDSPPFRELGNMVAIGITSAFINAILFLPAFMTFLPSKTSRIRKSSAVTEFMKKYSHFVTNKKIVIIISFVLLAAALLPGISKNEINEQYVKYFGDSIQFRRDTDFVSRNLTGVYSIEYDIPAGKFGSVNNPEFLELLEHFSQWYKLQPNVVHVYAVTDIYKRINRNMHNDDEQWYRLPASTPLSAQYLLLYEMSLPYGLGVDNQINLSKSATRLSIIVDDISTRELLDLEKTVQEWQKNNFPEDMQTQGTSPSIIFADIAMSNTPKMLFGTVAALILISCILVVALKSFRFGLISLVPNLVPIGIAFGIWGYLVGQIDLSLSIVAGLSLGIVVDDTVHFLSKYRKARQTLQFTPEQSVEYAFVTVGPALFITTAALSVGFSILMLSEFKPHAGLGALTSMTILLAFITDFLLLPALLLVLDRKKQHP